MKLPFYPSGKNKIMKSNKILSYAEYRQRIKELKNPEAMASFIKELLAPALSEAAKDVGIEEQEDSNEIVEVVDRHPATVTKRGLHLLPQDQERLSPWCEVIENETENKIISLYAKGLTTRDISNYLKSIHGIDIPQPSISTITDKVFPLVKEWQSRPLSSCYPMVYFDGLRFKVRDSGKIASKVAYIALGINQYGQKEILGIWVSESEGAKFWMHVLNDIKNRGVEDILIACVDGLKGFPEAINAIFPKTDVQVCVVHQIRHTVMFVAHKDRKRFCEDLKFVYTAPSEDAGMEALKVMEDQWPQYRPYLKNWEQRWSDLVPFFEYPNPVRKMVYTTNTIENLNRQFRKVTKTTQVFPHDDALIKLLWLAQADITQKWTMVIHNWGEAMAQLNILFPDRVQF